MTDFRLRFAARRSVLAPCLASCLAFCLAATALTARAADEPQNTGNANTFSAPGYPNAPRGAAQSGQPSAPGTTTLPQGMRPMQTPGSYAINPRDGTRMPDQSEPTLRRENQPPPKPGEFQKFVETATGRL